MTNIVLLKLVTLFYPMGVKRNSSDYLNHPFIKEVNEGLQLKRVDPESENRQKWELLNETLRNEFPDYRVEIVDTHIHYDGISMFKKNDQQPGKYLPETIEILKSYVLPLYSLYLYKEENNQKIINFNIGENPELMRVEKILLEIFNELTYLPLKFGEVKFPGLLLPDEGITNPDFYNAFFYDMFNSKLEIIHDNDYKVYEFEQFLMSITMANI